jgi:hypothetical protein
VAYGVVAAPARDWGGEDRAGLELRLGRVLERARVVVEKLGAEGYGEGTERIRPEKVIAETSLLMLAAWASRPGEENRRRVDALADDLVPWARGKRALAGLCFEPALALEFAMGHICLKRMGRPDAVFDEALKRALGSQTAGSRERPPHRVMEQEWLRAGWGAREHETEKAALRQSVLARTMDLLGGSLDDGYAFTHAMMYASDFGMRRMRLPRPKQVVMLEAADLVARCLDEENYDLGGEALLAWPLAGAEWTPEAAFAFRVLLRAEEEAGVLPAPGLKAELRWELAGAAPGREALAAGYHTAYVMGLVCAAVMRRGGIPYEVHGRARRGAAGLMMRWIAGEGRGALWLRELEGLSEADRDALAGMVFSIALRRKVRERDFGGMLALLAEAHGLGLTHRPVASQAAEMLDRVRVFGGAVQ